MVLGQMNEPPGVPDEGSTDWFNLAEYPWCRRSGCLAFIDNIFRFTQAGSGSVCPFGTDAISGWLPTGPGPRKWDSCRSGHLQRRVWLPPSRLHLCSLAGWLYPAPATASFAHLDSTTNLERKLQLGIYPAVDPFISSSMSFSSEIVGEDYYEVAMEVETCPSAVSGITGHHRHLGMDELSDEEKL